MNLQNLRIFLKVAELEHVTRASEELHISQPAVTKTIQSLEQEIHLELVERQGRRIVLTHAGHVLRDYARRMFALEREMEEGLSALRDLEGGEVTFAANTTAWVYLLPPIVARFRACYPNIALHVAILNSHDIIEQTVDWTLDFGLIEGEVAAASDLLKLQVFAHDELVLVVAPQHRWSHAQAVQPADLAHGELLLREHGSGIREVVEHNLLRHHVHVTPLFTLTDNEAIKQMVIYGVGAGVFSTLSVQSELTSGELVQVPVAGMYFRAQVGIVQRVDKHLSRAAQAFCAFLYAEPRGNL